MREECNGLSKVGVYFEDTWATVIHQWFSWSLSSSFRSYSGLFNSFQYYLLEVSALYLIREEIDDEKRQNCDHEEDKECMWLSGN